MPEYYLGHPMNSNPSSSFVKIVFGVALVLAFATASLWLFFQGKRYEVRITEAQVQEKMQKAFPFSKNYLLFFKVGFENPRFKIDAETGRVHAGMDMKLDFLKNGEDQKPLAGKLDFNSKVIFNSETHAFYLSEPTLEQLSIPGLPDKWRERTEVFLTKVLTQYYRDQPVYVLTDKNLKTTTAKLLLKSLKVDGTTIVVELGV